MCVLTRFGANSRLCFFAPSGNSQQDKKDTKTGADAQLLILLFQESPSVAFDPAKITVWLCLFV